MGANVTKLRPQRDLDGVSRSVEGRPGVVRDDRTAAEAGPAEGGGGFALRSYA